MGRDRSHKKMTVVKKDTVRCHKCKLSTSLSVFPLKMEMPFCVPGLEEGDRIHELLDPWVLNTDGPFQICLGCAVRQLCDLCRSVHFSAQVPCLK